MKTYSFLSFTTILCLRIVAALLSISWHVPDEIWQSTEVAHTLVFGYGTRTWEWTAQIRSFLHPVIFVPWFQLLKYLGVSDPYWFILGPRVIQALFSSLGDVSLLRALSLILERKNQATVKECFVWLYFGNCFMNYCASRPLINAFEAAMSNIALYLFFIKNTSCLVALLSVGFIVRPTLVLLWFPMAIFYLLDLVRKGGWSQLGVHVGWACLAGGTSFASMGLMDSFLYGNWTFTPWNFFKWNILSGVGSFYGDQPTHWYLSNASLTLCNLGVLPLLLFFFRRSGDDKRLRPLLVSVLAAVTGFSFIGHKEHRFVLPLLPILMIFASKGLAQWRMKTAFLWMYVPLNLLAFIYISTIHQSGSTRVMYPYLSRELTPEVNSRVLFLMPCHSTPHQSYLHRPDVHLRFLSCEPPGTDGIDEAEEFYSNPQQWLLDNNSGHNSSAELILLFDHLEESLLSYLKDFGYEIRNRIFHTHFPSGRIGKEILVYQKKNTI